MKRIITLVLLAGAFSAANAQSSRDDDRRVVINNGSRYPGNNGRDVIIGNGPSVGSYPSNNYGFNRQVEIDRVNREYDARIQAVWNDRYLHRGEKKRITRDLDRERKSKIDDVNRRCDAWDRDHRNDRRDNDWHRDGRH